MPNIQLILTSDGSHSLLNTTLNETYHSRHGALQESQYVFIQQGLEFFVERTQAKQLSILEVGFGTGLNAWLTFQFAQQHSLVIHYTSLETFPLPKEVWQALNYTTSTAEAEAFHALHEATWNQRVEITENFSLLKKEQPVQQLEPKTHPFNIIYFDAFAPNKQPELWQLEVLQKTTDVLTPGGLFVTYCAKGQLKRDLRSLGLHVEALPGPPGKREMVRATRLTTNPL